MYAVIESSLYDLAEMIKLDGPRGESERSTSVSFRRVQGAPNAVANTTHPRMVVRSVCIPRGATTHSHTSEAGADLHSPCDRYS